MRKLLIALLAFSLVGCKDDSASKEAAEADISPSFSVTDTIHYEVTVEEQRELRRASMDAAPKRSRIATLALTVKPVDDEVHFLWTDPAVEDLPVETREQKITYTIARFNAMWSPSFAVSKDGKFLRVLEEDLIRTGFQAATKATIEEAKDPRVARRIANAKDPVEVMTDIGIRRWNEMGGAFLPFEFTYGEPIDTELGQFEAIEETKCPTGQCWKLRAKTEVSKEELGEIKEQLAAMNGKVLEGSRELVSTNDVETMLPTSTVLTFDLSLELRNKFGEQEKGGTTVTERVQYKQVDEAPARVELEEMPSLEEPLEVDTEAGSDAGATPDSGAP